MTRDHGGKGWRWARWAVIGCCALGWVLVLSLAAGGTALLAEDSGTIVPAARSTGDDGLWLGHAWVDGRHTQADLAALVTRLRGTGIRDLFVHSGPLNDDGTLNPALYPRASWLIGALRAALPRVRVQAWLGDLVGNGHLNLENGATRENIVASAAQVLADGFDGVHLDLEPVSTGDPGYLTLLGQVHALTSSRHRMLSVAADQIEPLPALHTPYQWFLSPHWWSAGYLHQVALRTDEVAIMSYDTAMPSSGMYAGYIRRETGLALAAVPARDTLLMGAPAFHPVNFGHYAWAETVAGTVRGVRMAISPSPPDRPVGIALYVDFTATPADWAAYVSGWVRPTP